MDNASDRVRRRLQTWLHANHTTKAEVSRKLGNTPGWIAQFLTGGQDLGLRYVDPLADLMGWNPSDLVAYDAAVTPPEPEPESSREEEDTTVPSAQYLAGVMKKLNLDRQHRVMRLAMQLEAEQAKEDDLPTHPSHRKRRGSA